MIDTMKTTLATVLCVALLAAGCGDPMSPPAPTPVAPTISEPFSGTLLPVSVSFHTFAVAKVGGLKVTLNSVDPGAAVGVGVGTPGGGGCVLLSGVTAVGGASVQISGTATVVGNYCVSVYDVGNLVESIAYTVTVNHS